MRKPRPLSAKAPSATDAAVGRNVRIRRLAKGLSQSELGERLGVTFQQVQKYEKGTNRIGSGRLAQIADVLEVTVASLFEGAAGEPPGDTAVPLHLIAHSHSLRLAQAFATIEEPAMRLSIVEMVEALAAVAGRARHPR
jgi:transcriptional regulator with XRE-family HTH domain